MLAACGIGLPVTALILPSLQPYSSQNPNTWTWQQANFLLAALRRRTLRGFSSKAPLPASNHFSLESSCLFSLSHTESSPSHPSETGHVRTSSQSDEQRESRELIRDKKRPLASHILLLSLLQYTRCQSKGK